MAGTCLVCDRIAQIKEGNDPGFVKEYETGYVILGDAHFFAPQYGHCSSFKGYTVFLCKQCVPELHDLDVDFRGKFLEEMSEVSAAVFRAFKPRKMNYELLGNICAHLHWHLFPRHEDDPNPNVPVWSADLNSESLNTEITEQELRTMKDRLLSEL